MGMTLVLMLGFGVVVFVVAFAVTSQLQRPRNHPPVDGFSPRDGQRWAQGSHRSRVQPVENQLPSGNSTNADQAMALAEIESELRSLLANGQRIEALKRVRVTAGWGLKKSKNYLERLEIGKPNLVNPTNDPLAEIDNELRSLLAHNRKIEAIKQVRIATGWGLKDSKDYIDQLEARW
ncbi:MAG: hypothetical protein AAF215_12340 [Cyanobacteria bacterium P01_A01_bin.123]